MKINHINCSLLRFRLERPVGGTGVASVDVILAEVQLDGGTQGLGFSYVVAGSSAASFAAAKAMAALLEGSELHHPEATWRQLAATFNRTRRGPNFVGLAAIDVALWDAYAKSLGLPMGVAMGGSGGKNAREVPLYASGGFNTLQSPQEAAESAARQSALGYRGVKPRVSGRRSDTAVMEAVRKAIPDSVEMMVDANEKCSALSARRLAACAAGCGALFVEEPLPADDLAGFRQLAAAYPRLIATGEHLQGMAEALPFIEEGLLGMVQPDLAAMGGLTECLRVMRVAEAFGMEASGHFLPGLFVHLAAAAPNLSWLEEFPMLEPLFTGWPAMSPQGTLRMSDAPGHGLALAADALKRYGV
jgi:L-alanine-DL-glutamate epimerase-like enolase superfamily enzyme